MLFYLIFLLKMSYIVVIREQNYKDAQYINDLVRGAYLSNVNSAWYNALLKEVKVFDVTPVYLKF